MNGSRFLGVALALLVAGCASGQRGADDTAAEGRRDINRISAEEVRGATQVDALDLVQDLRPGWRGSTVYQDNFQLGDMGELRGYPLGRVDWMEYLERTEAISRFGMRHGSGGAIIIHTR